MFKKKTRRNNINQLEIVNRPKSVISEQFRTLRTNVLFTSSDVHMKKIIVTSSEPSEGKSTISANLAISFTQAGYKTILIDADMRKPTQHKVFEMMNVKGLSNLVAGQVQLVDAINKEVQPGLDFISAGPIPPNPAEILGSTAMTKLLEELETVYDIIVLDTPPVLAVADSQILGNMADGSLLVVNGRKTHRDKVIDAKAQLEKCTAKLLGVVLNDLNKKDDGEYYYYYGEKEKN
ncbi:CpsD/CapB family tyrosine-protein kinase [Macrococcus sp. DPC7161]|uniref:CpsD/CapB family tyrosine-protein kinase n=1 Tax=Macrococcus sp. DPC7161 TaxID=2507060 RepID=UPI00100C2B2D|nr:CpsD/CapB family tyrosine-protein kinase [Macrococcus sp. DPC7161]RXK17224.1 polysaccharide biosynthesis tyrosine autokinase [Macrococcus sp. DPC7161]